MNDKLKVWNNFFEDSDEVNIIQLEDDSIWFQFSHLCKVLGYKNPSVAIQTHCEDYEIRKLDIGQYQEVNFISESGFYSLVLGSKKPKAKQFKKWICTEVLPKVRASGGYISSAATSDQLQALKEEIENAVYKRAIAWAKKRVRESYLLDMQSFEEIQERRIKIMMYALEHYYVHIKRHDLKVENQFRKHSYGVLKFLNNGSVRKCNVDQLGSIGDMSLTEQLETLDIMENRGIVKISFSSGHQMVTYSPYELSQVISSY